MLYQIGGIQFTAVGALNTHEVSRETAADFAEKDVYGVLKPAEFVGPGDDVIKLSCRAFTQIQGGALAAFDALDQMRLSGTPQIFVRGDGYNLGWRRITNVTQKDRFLDISGVGKVIDYEITLKLTPPPSAGDMVTSLFAIAVDGLASLFGSLFGD